ncbi:MAG: hypothetical protein KBD15_00630 [Candidatus Magasanikbacteria bacterium]|nr:hypothetical protein [Candidatus Magasanikbacteria bacterium]
MEGTTTVKGAEDVLDKEENQNIDEKNLMLTKEEFNKYGATQNDVKLLDVKVSNDMEMWKNRLDLKIEELTMQIKKHNIVLESMNNRDPQHIHTMLTSIEVLKSRVSILEIRIKW